MEAEPQPQGTGSSRRAGARDCGLLATVAPMAARSPAAVAAGPMTLVLPATVVPETPESPAVTAAPAIPTTPDAEKAPLTLVPSPPPSPGHSGHAHSPGSALSVLSAPAFPPGPRVMALTVAMFLGCAFMAFGPVLALYIFTVTAGPLHIIFLIIRASVLPTHLLVSALTFINPRCGLNLVSAYIILVLRGIWASFASGGSCHAKA
ncbi:hypothetical protein J1605_022262 [Eschrichtius robustus]|uniref:Gamma-secretase subunit APH-1 n=1 Tax=Eschrichtius robustus TaxID=9764 RepID=A0AB34HEB1_ESCRO|nr:hypothetical protein J1605_022262 [Eschrichtius robustus]